MKKIDLIALYAEATGMPKTQAAEDLEKLGDIMAAELLAGGEVPLPHVGKLVIKKTLPHKGRNPRTGEAIDLPASRKVKLNVGKELKESFN